MHLCKRITSALFSYLGEQNLSEKKTEKKKNIT